MHTDTSISDQFANLSPVIIVAIVVSLTLLRLVLIRVSQSWARVVSEVCDTGTFVLVFAFLLVRPFVAQAFYIPSESMEGTLLVNDRLIVDKFSYRLHDPQRGDVVVFDAPPAAEVEDGIDYIKRLIGAPGDTIQVRAASMTIDGRPFEPGLSDLRSYLRESLSLAPDDAVKIFPDHLLVNGTRVIHLDELARAFGRGGSKIVLTPGETLRNGTVLDEPYTREDPDYNFPAEGGVFHVGPGQYFMMGDNRNRSKDSHYWGALDRSRVVGHAELIFWPGRRFGVIH